MVGLGLIVKERLSRARRPVKSEGRIARDGGRPSPDELRNDASR
jgi:hypothetical protein